MHSNTVRGTGRAFDGEDCCSTSSGLAVEKKAAYLQKPSVNITAILQAKIGNKGGANRLAIRAEQQQSWRMPKSNSASAFNISLTLPSLLLLLLLLLIATEIKCQTERLPVDASAALAAAEASSTELLAEPVERRADSSDEEAMRTVNEESMITQQPRQQFKIYLGPMSRPKSKVFKPHGSKLEDLHRRDSTESSAGSANQTTSSFMLKSQLSKQANTKKISGATLKKLLNQTLPKYLASNGTDPSTGKGSNFKFVYIQRATAPSAGNSTAVAATTNDEDSRPAGADRVLKKATQLQTLAASVSKSLAKSLLYTSQSVGSQQTSPTTGLSSATQTTKGSIAPSISLLVSQMATKVPSAAISSEPDSIRESTPLAEVQPLEIKRLKVSESSASRKRPTNNRTTKPSKIYNLPVKFVSNGQPNHIVFHALKEHFATIRRLQQSAAKMSGRKRKDPHKQVRLKGLNSRLVYLPLKYLSNARPHGIHITPKAAHKSKPTSLGRSSDHVHNES